MVLPVRHILLRDAEWLCHASGLERAPDGSLSLLRIPAPDAGAVVAHDGPFDAEPSGIAALDELNVFIADTGGRRIVASQRQCDATFLHSIGGSPAGMAIHAGVLYIADRARRCIRRFDITALDERPAIGTDLADPTGVSVDSEGRVYALDRGANRVRRFTASGIADTGYAPAVVQPLFLAMTASDALLVSDAANDTIRVFDSTGAFQGEISSSLGAPAIRPGALAARDQLLFVANVVDGAILVFDWVERALLGEIVDFRGPVAAMNFDGAGNLLLKLEGGPDYLRFAADSARLTGGAIEAGPFDAGENNDWERAALTLSAGSARLSTFTAAARGAAVVWRAAPGHDCLVNPQPGPAPEVPDSRRYLWLRVELTGSGRETAVLEQVAAETRGENYLDDLPRIYRRDDQATRFLERWLTQFRGQLDDRERHLHEVAREFDPLSAPPARLSIATDAIAFDVPQGTGLDATRALLARAPELYARRGTLAGVADMVEVQSGIRPQIFEDFRARNVWQLGTTSLLGVDTQLAAATPEGLIVPRDARTDPAYAGLRGEYYAGVDFNELLFVRTDPSLDFGNLSVDDRNDQALDRYSVRWQGQIRPHYSETYLLSFEWHGGLRVWLDGHSLINRWSTENPRQTLGVRIALEGNRWHELRIEYMSVRPPRPFNLSWSSRHQRPQIVPRECLYSILDDHADLQAPPPSTFDVGHAVVGESGPLAPGEFGDGLFSDYAHLFTVVAPAGSCRDAAARAALREAIEAEKPVHTDYHLCFVEPRMRVGFQARLGIDAIVANGPPPLRLDGTRLDRDSYLGDARDGARVAERARLGQDTVVS
ncbi:MAG: PA14 domain-containing protein [Pseudomonadota bacterium]